MADLLAELGDRIQSLGANWAKYMVVGSFVLYLTGYLALRFHVTTIGLGTDLAVLDERYFFTGARFVVYLVSSVPNVVLLAFPLMFVGWVAYRVLPPARASARWLARPGWLASLGILFSVGAIQLVMRQCFFLHDLLLAPQPPTEPAWLVHLLLEDELMPLYFSGLVASCAVTLAILWVLRGTAPSSAALFARGLLAFLAAVQVLFLPINYGVLIVDKSLPRVASLGTQPLGEGEAAWLVWEAKDAVTFLHRIRQPERRALVTIPRAEVKRIEIVGFDKIVPLLFRPPPVSSR